MCVCVCVCVCRWFCHVDDDVYVNVEQLVRLLKKYDPEREVYLGRWSLAQTTKLEVNLFSVCVRVCVRAIVSLLLDRSNHFEPKTFQIW